MNLRRIISLLVFCFILAGSSLPLYASEAFQFGFRVGGSGLDTTYKYNARASARMREALMASNISGITVTAYSSPDGKYSRNRQLAALRAASAKDLLLSYLPALADSVSVNTVVVAEDWEGVKRYLKRSNLEWKDDALAILSSSDNDKEALLKDLWVGEAWEDLMKNCFPGLRRVTVSIQEKVPSDGSDKVSDCIEVIFGSGSTAFSTDLRPLANSNSPYLYIYIKASPEGDEAANERLSMRRAERIKSKLAYLGYGGEVITIYQGEDWAGLANAVKESPDMPDKDAVLDILANNSLDRASRKHALQRLGYGKTWLRLMSEEMSGLRKAVISPNKL